MVKREPRPVRESWDEEVFTEMDEWASLLHFAGGVGSEGASLPWYSWETKNSLISSVRREEMQR